MYQQFSYYNHKLGQSFYFKLLIILITTTVYFSARESLAKTISKDILFYKSLHKDWHEITKTKLSKHEFQFWFQ